MASKFKGFLDAKVVHHGYTGVTFQIRADDKARIDQIALALGRSSSEVYRQLIEASLEELEDEVESYLAARPKVKK